jgi:hypothetical protein
VRKPAKKKAKKSPAVVVGRAFLRDLTKSAKRDTEDVMDILKNKSWPTGQATNQERGAYKLGQLTALEVALGGEQALAEIPKGVLTDQDVLVLLEDLLLKGKITPQAAQTIIQKLVAQSSGQAGCGSLETDL